MQSHGANYINQTIERVSAHVSKEGTGRALIMWSSHILNSLQKDFGTLEIFRKWLTKSLYKMNEFIQWFVKESIVN